MQNICIDCTSNNNGWCKVLKKNGNKDLKVCAFRSKTGLEVDWQAYGTRPVGFERDLLGKLLVLLETSDNEAIKKLLDDNGILRK